MRTVSVCSVDSDGHASHGQNGPRRAVRQGRDGSSAAAVMGVQLIIDAD